MKLIDLLNKIANGEKVPKKIHIKQFQCDFIFNGHTYLSDEEKQQNIYWCLHSDALNYEVEIIEEEKIKMCNVLEHCVDFSKNENILLDNQLRLQDKINELIAVLNEM